MKIILAGGTGFLGESIIQHVSLKASFVVLTRSNKQDRDNVKYVQWDGKTLGNWVRELEGADVVINLAGKSVNCRYNTKNKKAIYDSRTNATHVLGEAILKTAIPPKLWLNSSSATIYRHETGEANDEYEGKLGEGFSVDVCKQWEQAFHEIKLPQTRKVVLRSSIVLGNGGGVYATLASLARKGLGGQQGHGHQWVSWIHEEDFVGILEFIINNADVSGTINLAAPNPVVNKEFMKSTRKKVRVPFGLDQTNWMVKIGAFLLGTEAELVLKSRRVVSKKLPEWGYAFKYPTLEEALKKL